MTSPSATACCNGAGGCGSANGAGSGCDKKIDKPSSNSMKSIFCARCPDPSDVPTSSFGSAALCSSCLREALRSRVAREAVDLGIKGQRVVVAWSGGPSSRLLAQLLAAVAAPANYPGARPSFEVVAAVRVDCRPWRTLHRSKALSAEIQDAAAAASVAAVSTDTAAAAAASPPTTVVPVWLALAEDAKEGLHRLELLHASLEEAGNDDEDDEEKEGEEEQQEQQQHQQQQQRRRKKRRRRPRSELATARLRAERSLVRAALLRFARSHKAGVVATAETATRCAASAVVAAAAGAGAALPLEVAGCDRRFCSEEEGEGSVSFVRPFVSVPASDVEAAARLLGLSSESGEEGEGGEQEQQTDGVLAAASDFLGAAQARVPSTAASVVAALSKLAPCGWAGRRREDASRSLPPRELCDLCAAGPWSRGDGAEVEVEGDQDIEKKEEKKLVLLRLCYPCSTVALGAPPAPAGAAPVVPRAGARKMAQALFGRGERGGLYGRR